MLRLVVSLVTGLPGVLLLYLAYLLDEAEERTIQSRLEEWWVTVDDASKSALARHVRLFAAAGQMVDRSLTWAFGSRLRTLRAFWSAACLTYGGVWLVIFLGRMIGSPSHRGTPQQSALRIVMAISMFGLGVIPAFWPSRGFLRIGCAVGLAILALSGGLKVVSDVSGGMAILASIASYAALIIGFTAGVFFTLVLTVFFRWGARAISLTTTSRRLLLILFAQAMTVASLVVIQTIVITSNLVPYSLETLPTYKVLLATTMLSFSMISIVGSWPVIVYMLSLSLLIIHRILWPILSRPLYAIQRHRIFENRRILAVIGVILLITSGLPPLVFIGRDVLQAVGLK